MTYLDNSNIPEEYKEQIAQLIESNDENNWDIVGQLFRGWYDEIRADSYFYNLMTYYYHKYKFPYNSKAMGQIIKYCDKLNR